MMYDELNVGDLADEFGTDQRVLAAFIETFAPRLVHDNKFTASADTMLFVHIPKTAGVSVGKAFHSTFDRFYSIQWDNIGPSFRQATRRASYEQSRSSGRQVIMGHFGWPEIQLWRNHEMAMKCGAIFREPTARIVSNFNYNSSAAHPGHEKFIKRFPTLESYAIDVDLDFQLTKTVGFISSFEEALVKLTKYYTFLGLTERLSASLTHLSRSHGLSGIKEHRENIGKSSVAPLSKDILALMRERNHNDAKIHQLLLKIYDF
jgi:hypothetical protein